jgi:uncharacterized repeat protein (TIGR03803 family)
MFAKLLAASAALLAIYAAAPAEATSFTTYYQFPGGGDGLLPYGGLVDQGGTLYGITQYGGATGRGAVFAVNTKTGAETLAYSFKGGTDGYFPQAGLISVGKLLYGTTAYGGTGSTGTVFSLNPATGAEKVIYAFTQASGSATNTPLYYASGYLYGETYVGGANNQGTIFKIDVKTGAETTLYSFRGGSDGCYGSNGALVQVGKLLYGTTYSCGENGGGVLFSIDPKTGAETVLHSFGASGDGYGADGGVIAEGTTLYGTTAYGGNGGYGTVYSFDTVSGIAEILYNFADGTDGGAPQDSLVYVTGTLYGTNFDGGASGFGTVFAVSAKTGAETTLYNFTGGTDGGHPLAPLIAVSGTLYGTSLGPEQLGGNAGSVVAVSIKKNAETTLHDFVGPHPFFQSNSGLLASGSLLYGETGNGGSAYGGTIYQLDPATGAGTMLYNFTGGADGSYPTGGLTASGSLLYGVATLGANAGQGTIFSFDPATGTEKTLYIFGGNDGANPNGPLISYKNLLYGTTRAGGSFGVGTIFSIDPANGALTTLYSFSSGNQGQTPEAGLIENGGVLYGTTLTGGVNFAGDVFAFDLKTKTETELYSFTGGADGLEPLSALTYAGGMLYGATELGGSCAPYSYGCGVVFGVNIKTHAETVLHNFTGGDDGLFPGATLTYSNNTLYGAAYQGGANSVGTIFSIVPTSGGFTTLYSFTGGSDGYGPGSPLLDQAGTLISATGFAGTQGAGTVFGLTP